MFEFNYRLIIFFTAFTSLTLLLFYGISRRFIRPVEDPGLKKFFRLTALGLLTVMVTSPILYRQVHSLYGTFPMKLLMIFHYLLMGVISFIIFFMVIARIFELTKCAVDRARNKPVDLERRRFLTNAVNIGILTASGGSTLIGFNNAIKPPQILDIKIPLANYTPELEDFTLVQISDLHIGPTLDGDFTRDIVERVNQLKPSMVAITGDLVDGKVEQLKHHVAPLQNLKSTYGSYFVTGNHEYYSGADVWMDYLHYLGIDVLENEHRIITHRGKKLLLGGVPDYRTSPVKSSPIKAMEGAPGDCSAKILLAHQPKNCFEAVKAGFEVQLSGHTHGGQFVPWTWLIGLFHPYVKGLNNHEGMWVYVNSGTGYWGPPVRMGTKPEITRITFTS